MVSGEMEYLHRKAENISPIGESNNDAILPVTWRGVIRKVLKKGSNKFKTCDFR